MTKKPASTTKKDASAASDQSAEKKLIADNVQFSLTLPAAEVAASQERALLRAQKAIKLDGFRQGKAPLKLIEKQVDRSQIFSMIVEDLIPAAYQKHMAENMLNSLTEPEIVPESLNEGQDWKFTIHIAPRPEVKLGDYVQLVQKIRSEHEAWKETEKKEGETLPAADQKRQEQLSALVTGLLETIEIPVPELLLRRETEYQLRQLGTQLEKMNLKLEQYLQAVGKTLEELQQEYAARALANLQSELLLSAIIADQNLTVSDQEIESLFHPDGHDHGHDHHHSDQEMQYARALLLKQKAFDFLLNA